MQMTTAPQPTIDRTRPPAAPHAFRFGVVANAGPRGDDWTELARRIEALGFSTLLLPDNPQAAPALFSTLSWAAAGTTTLHVGTYVAVADLRHPLQLAREAATLQQLSGGRFELGLGAGRPGAERDYAELGVPMGTPGERVSRLEATIDAIDRLFAGERVDHDATLGPVLAGAPRPHLLVAASGPRMLALAGRRADTVALGIRPDTPLDEARRLTGVVRAAAAGREKPPEINLNLSGVGERMVSYARGMAARRDELAASQAPSFLMGSVDAMVEGLHWRREVLGLNYIAVGAELIDEIAPVVRQLAGR
jgi:probable F420-dependent oxidoreductase